MLEKGESYVKEKRGYAIPVCRWAGVSRTSDRWASGRLKNKVGKGEFWIIK